MNSEYLDLSLIRVQNSIAETFADFFSVKELEQLNLTDVTEPSKRDINNNCHLFYEKTFTGKNRSKFCLLDILIITDTPITRFLDIRLSQGKKIQIDIKCKHSRKNIDNLKIIIAKALNFANYRSKYDRNYYKKSIYDNFVNEFVKIVESKDVMEEIKFLLDYLNNSDSLLDTSEYNYDFSLSNIECHINANGPLIKFTVKRNDNEKYIYILRNQIGVSTILLLVEQALIQFKK